MTAPKINVLPTPDAERVVKLVEFAWAALDYLVRVDEMFNSLIKDEVITEKGPDGDLVAVLVAQGQLCFPPKDKETIQ